MICVDDDPITFSAATTEFAQRSLASTGLFHASIWATRQRNLALAGELDPDNHDGVMDYCYAVALRSARQVISDLGHLATDARKDTLVVLVMTAMLLSSELGDRSAEDGSEISGPRQSSLKTLQALNIWGAGRRYVNVHGNAVRDMMSLTFNAEIVSALASQPLTL